VLMESQPDYEPIIRELKFKSFNQVWLDVVDQELDSTGIANGGSSTPDGGHLNVGLGLYDDDEVDEGQVMALLESPTPGLDNGTDLSFGLSGGERVELPSDDDGGGDGVLMDGYV
jgi:hypothetical protein